MDELQEQIRLSINNQLDNCLTESVLSSPQEGIQRIRSILHKYEFDLPAFYDMDPNGEELFIEMDKTGTLTENEEQDYLYLIYYLTEDNRYEFHAEMVNEQELNEILSEDVPEEE